MACRACSPANANPRQKPACRPGGQLDHGKDEVIIGGSCQVVGNLRGGITPIENTSHLSKGGMRWHIDDGKRSVGVWPAILEKFISSPLPVCTAAWLLIKSLVKTQFCQDILKPVKALITAFVLIFAASLLERYKVKHPEKASILRQVIAWFYRVQGLDRNPESNGLKKIDPAQPPRTRRQNRRDTVQPAGRRSKSSL
jgi:hypothetical protein